MRSYIINNNQKSYFFWIVLWQVLLFMFTYIPGIYQKCRAGIGRIYQADLR